MRRASVTATVLLVVAGLGACLDLDPAGRRFACPECPGDAGDAGTDAGDASTETEPVDAGDAGADASTSVDASVPDAAFPEPVRDGGWQFQALQVDFGPSANGDILSITSRSGQLLVAHERGRLLFRTGGTWSLLQEFGNTASVLDAAGLAPDGAVFLFAGRRAGVCKTGCTDGANYTWTTVLPLEDTLYGVCGTSSSNMFAVGTRSNSPGVLYRYDGDQWTKLSNDLGVYAPLSCSVDANGVVWIPGGAKVARYDAVNGITTESIDAGTVPVSNLQLWYGSHSTQGWLHAVGQVGNAVSRSPQGQWTLFKRPTGYFQAVGSAGDTVFAGGSSEAVDLTTLYEFKNQAWTKRPALPSLTTVTAIGGTAPDEIFFGGTVATSKAGLVRGVR